MRVFLEDEDDLPVWKKPRANLPLAETSFSLPASAWPGRSVSVAAEGGGACRMTKRSTERTKGRRRCMAEINGGAGDGSAGDKRIKLLNRSSGQLMRMKLTSKN